ncbi:unnamed protein product [Paramecium octaurelia]|uniref:Uncharacterized protein n=1 Tax=Paramecium octaurelia TaxID=43137 RepID=A0A8S1RZY5_PAROT|nr:unnamed protein product [Paramecium octaurelia]
MLNLKESQDWKKGKKLDSATLMQLICFFLLLVNHNLNGMTQYSEASIFQADQFRIPEEHSFVDEYFNFGDTNNFAFSDIDFEMNKLIPIEFPFIDNMDMEDQFTTGQQQTLQFKPISMQQQYDILFEFKSSIKSKVIGGSDLFSKVLDYANKLQLNKFKSIPKINDKNQKKVNHSFRIKGNKPHKFMISKLESWDVHLKSIRTHFMQKIFNKLWKVPTQQILKAHCFSGKSSQQNKIQIIAYLQNEIEQIEKQYSEFQLKQEIYQNIIQRMIFCLDLATQLNNQADDLIFDILFKGFIAELFHY